MSRERKPMRDGMRNPNVPGELADGSALLVYRNADGDIRIDVRLEDQTGLLTQDT